MTQVADAARSSSHSVAAPLSFDVDKLVTSMRRHMRAFLITFLLVTAVVALVLLSRTPRYEATAVLLINEHVNDVLHLNNVTPQEGLQPQYGASSTAVDTEVEVLRSRAMSSSIVDQLHLDQDPEFYPALASGEGKLARLMRTIGLNSSPPPPPPDLGPIGPLEHEQVVNALLRAVTIKRTGLTYTIDVTAKTLKPDKSARIANAFAQRYLTQTADTHIDETHNATTWLDSRLSQLRNDAQSADTAVQQYKIQHNLMSAQGATLTEQEISTLDTQLAQARTADAEQEARLHTAQRQLAAGSNGGDVGEAMNNAVVQNLRAQRAQASAQLADLQARYGDRYAEVVKAKQDLEAIDAQIASEIERTISNLKAQAEISRTRVASIAANAAQSRGALVSNNEAEVRLDQLQRDAEAARSIYDAFLERYKEALAKEGDLPTDAKMVSPAKPPTGPSSPNPKLDMLIALGAGLVSGLAAMLVADFLSRGVSNLAEVEELFDLPALGEIPVLASTLPLRKRRDRPEPSDYLVKFPLSRFAESFRNLRSSISSSRVGQNVQVVALTSSLPNEGKTTTAICLARTVALAGSRVVLVDCDLRQRAIGRVLGSEPTQGLVEVLSGSASLDEVLVRDTLTDMQILPLASSAFTPKDVFGSEAMRGLIAELRTRFDVVLLDTAPVLAVADTRVLAPLADATVFLTRWRKTTRQTVVAALRGLGAENIFIAGVALTQVDLREQALAGEGASHYYRAYAKYYVG